MPDTDTAAVETAGTAARANGGDIQLPDRDEYNAFISGVALVGINVVSLGAERTGNGDSEQTRFKLEVGYQTTDNTITYRFTARASLASDDDTEVGTAHATIVATFRTPTMPGPACIEHFGAQSAAVIVHPYIRETLMSATQRLGFQGAMLPLIVRQPQPPQTE